jgi:hypothetical protein
VGHERSYFLLRERRGDGPLDIDYEVALDGELMGVKHPDVSNGGGEVTGGLDVDRSGEMLASSSWVRTRGLGNVQGCDGLDRGRHGDGVLKIDRVD